MSEALPVEQTSYHHVEKSNVSTQTEFQKKFTFLDLNDDCLLEIYDHLGVNDLCAVSKVCKRLKTTSEFYFPRKYKKLDFAELKDAKDEFVAKKNVKIVLSRFGKLITSIEVSNELLNRREFGQQDILRYIAKFCASTLYELEMYGFADSAPGIASSLNEMISLKSLSMNSLHSNFIHSPAISDNIYPALEKFESFNEFEMADVYEFIENHKHLKKLSLCDNSHRANSEESMFFTIIAEQLTNLQELTISALFTSQSQAFLGNILSLIELKQLKIFKLLWFWKSIATLFNGMTSNGIQLEHLHLVLGWMDDETMNAIAQMKTLKMLTFYDVSCLNDKHIIKFAQELPNLNELHIYTGMHITEHALQEVVRFAEGLSYLKIRSLSFELNLKWYNNILHFIKQRRDKDKCYHLKVTIVAPEDSVVIPKDVIDSNKKCLEIDVLDYSKQERPFFPKGAFEF